MSEYIPGVDSGALANARATGAFDPGSRALVAAESGYIDKRRVHHGLAEDGGAPRRTALALSGGGIRSATFALGVMQRLAKDDYLQLFDYLSTVSGGGYTGCSTTWLTSQTFRTETLRRFGVNIQLGVRGGAANSDPFPYGHDDPREPIRHHPPKNEDLFLTYLRSHGEYLIPGGGITLLSGIVVALRGILLNLFVWFPIAVAIMAVAKLSWLDVDRFGFTIALVLAEFFGLLFAIASIGYSFYTFRQRSPQARRYRWRRHFETYARYVLLLAVALTVIGTLPWFAGFLENWIGQTGSVVALVGGIAGGLRSFFKSRTTDGGGLPLDVLAPISAVLFCYGFLLLAFHTAGILDQWSWDAPLAAAGVMLMFSFLLGWFTNLNYVTLHRYYRDRLMEAFMPDMDRVRDNQASAALSAEPARLSAMCAESEPRGPYHLINCNLILTGTADKTRKTRGGDSFLLSPLYCGSNATGWLPTKDFHSDEITLPTAMAISGAAANPNAGSGGTGITRNPIVSIVMSMLNVRLGYWVPNPNPAKASQKIRPNHFNPGLTDLIDYQRNENSKILRLSDGGHFDNLGLYELIRRRVEFIVCCDAGADPDYAFGDLTNAIARAEQDFGAVIKFEDPELALLMPSGVLDFPRRSPFSRRAHARARITYADGSIGTLIYLTTVIIRELRLQLLGYMGANPAFPDETTADQFFDEAQFEAYRELGFAVADRMLADPGKPASAGRPAIRGFADEFTKRLNQLNAMAPVGAAAAQ